ncbi:unnamed protein product [Ixodes pacificus]
MRDAAVTVFTGGRRQFTRTARAASCSARADFQRGCRACRKTTYSFHDAWRQRRRT